MVKETEYEGLRLIVDNKDSDKINIEVNGRLDTGNSNNFLEYMTKIINTFAPGSDLILSLSNLNYISSTGIGVFTVILGNSKKKDIHLILKDIKPKVKSIIDLLGFTSFFEFR